MSRITCIACLLLSSSAFAGDPPDFPADSVRVQMGMQAPNFAVADANLDGLPDVVVVGVVSGPVGKIACLPGTGGGRLGEPVITTGSPVFTIQLQNGKPTLADFDGDGVPDVAYPDDVNLATLTGLGDGSFTPLPELPIPNPLSAPLALDADADGVLDLVLVVTANGTGTPTLQLLAGVGDGSFTLGASLAQPFGARLVRGGDLDLDGDTDLVTWTSSAVNVNSTGGPAALTAGPSVPAPGIIMDVAVAQVTGSLHPDIVVARLQAPSAVTVFRNFGGTSFFALPAMPDQFGWDAVLIGDVGGDGLPDLVGRMGADTGYSLRVRSGIAGGSFGPPADTHVHLKTELVLADMDLDGRTDVVTSIGSTFVVELSVLRGLPGGSLEFHDTDGGAPAAEDLVLQDFDGDGFQDLASLGDGSLALQAGDGDGHLAEPVPATLVPPISAVMAQSLDLENDGDADLAVLWRDFVPNPPVEYLMTYRNTSALQLELAQVVLASPGLGDIVAGDFDGDGQTDLVLSRFTFPGGSAANFVRNVAGTFLAPVPLPAPISASSVEAGDLDADGDLDLVVGPNHQQLAGLLNDDLVFTASPVQSTDKWNEYSVADLDSDGFPDVAAACEMAGLELLHGNGAGGLQAPQVIGIAQNSWRLDIGDWDGDGDQDVACNTDLAGFQIALGDGAGSWQAGPRTLLPHAIPEIAGGDLDADGQRDLLANCANGTGQSGTLFFLNRLPPATWLALPAGKPGASGVPTLQGAGTLQPLSPVTLTLSHAAPLAPVTLVVGLSKLDLPFKGGLMVPSLDMILPGLASNGAGQLVLPATWPSGLPPGLSLWFQTWIADASATHGLSASTALKALTP